MNSQIVCKLAPSISKSNQEDTNEYSSLKIFEIASCDDEQQRKV
jgi:hypothetical protein